MATKSKAKEAVATEDKLDALANLQRIDSEIDRIRTVRGELPLEVQDLEDELEGLGIRKDKLEAEIEAMNTEVTDRKNAQKDSTLAITKYKEQQNNVRNNREYESLGKEIEFQELEIKLNDKKIKEAKAKIDHKKEILTEALERYTNRKGDLESKKGELDAIIAETQKDEEKLMKESAKAQGKIEDRLLRAYTRLRENSKNGLAVVPIDRKSCGGCFNKIPPQRQLDVASKKKIIVCEHCGRILIPAEEEA